VSHQPAHLGVEGFHGERRLVSRRDVDRTDVDLGTARARFVALAAGLHQPGVTEPPCLRPPATFVARTLYP
jgi:hypothetical protein